MSEIEALELAHRAAQAKLGLAVALASKEAWQGVDRLSSGRTGAAWSRDTAAATAAAQRLSAALARAYWNVARAIEIRSIMGDLQDGGPATLGNARDEFLRRVLAIDLLGTGEGDDALHKLIPPNDDLEQLDLTQEIQALLDEMDESADEDELAVDGYDWGEITDDEARAKSIDKALFGDAVSDHMDKSRILRTTASGDENESVDDANQRLLRGIEESWESHGKLGASKADNLALLNGRSVLEKAGMADKKVLMFARGTSSNPCHFCAMLASRGFVYASKQTAMRSYQGGGLRSYHPNCHCFPIARWVEGSALPQRNAWFQELWDSEISGGYVGNDAINAWRRLLNTMRDPRTGQLDFTRIPGGSSG